MSRPIWPALVRLRDNFTQANAEAEVTSLNAGFRAAYLLNESDAAR